MSINPAYSTSATWQQYIPGVIKGFKHAVIYPSRLRKAGTVKTGHISSPNVESSAQLESKAARSVNASQIHFSHYRNSTGVKDQERIMHTRRWK